jgi:hypothetical protein
VLTLEVDGLLALDDADEVAGDDAALVDELVEAVLPVGAGLPKVDLPHVVRQRDPVNGHALAVALHAHLDTGNEIAGEEHGALRWGNRHLDNGRTQQQSIDMILERAICNALCQQELLRGGE